MTSPPSTSPPYLYSPLLHLRLYQAFIFSIPILFSIALFLLLYFFYLKKSSSPASTPQPTLPISSTQDPLASSSKMVSKGKLKEKLEVVLFDDDFRTRDSMCCVCLGEFEVGEELCRIVACKHVFHMDCLCCWLHSNSTCPLCRCFVVSTIKHSCISQPIYGPSNPILQVVNPNPLRVVYPQLANVL